ncbi:50S ribosomal protein L11 methyltransferase [Paracoccaceae bacterium GXU_MW_L88]
MPVTYAAITTLNDEESAARLADAMEALYPEPIGIAHTLIEDGSERWQVGGYFDEKPDLAGLALLASIHDAPDFILSEVPETDWVAQVRRELTPIEAGRFFLYGSHDADKLPEGRVGLAIEAAMAFGTGHHGTTQGCLIALDKLASGGFAPSSVADIGCGTAVLAMGAAKLWDVPTLASDIDEVATDTARANIEHNGLGGKITVVTAPGFADDAIHAAAPFELIFANILKAPLIALAPDMARHITPGGVAILSGLLSRQADDVLEAYQAEGFTETAREQIEDWVTLTLKKG